MKKIRAQLVIVNGVDHWAFFMKGFSPPEFPLIKSFKEVTDKYNIVEIHQFPGHVCYQSKKDPTRIYIYKNPWSLVTSEHPYL